MTSDGLKGIERVYWPNLEALILNENKIDHLGIDLLIKATFSKSLKKLFLGEHSVIQETTISELQGAKSSVAANGPTSNGLASVL